MNTTTTHTPGPWAATDIGKVTARDAERCAANARLIAAAPELLAALFTAERELRLAADDAREAGRTVAAMRLHEAAIYAAEVLAKARAK